MATILSYVIAGFCGACLYDAAKWIWRVQPASRWLRRRRIEREYRATLMIPHPDGITTYADTSTIDRVIIGAIDRKP